MADRKTIKPLLLIVDDNPTNIDILVNALKDDYRLGVAKNGEKALSFASKHHPSLILLDIMMPGMDGFEVCNRLKDSPETMDIAIIFITAIHEASSKTKGFEIGAVDYITKPFNTTEVIARVRTHLDLIECRDRLEDLVEIRTEQLENANRDLAETRLQIIHRLGKVVEYRDNETGKHVIRVSHYSATLAEGLGLPARRVELIRLCSPIHDIGKIGVPDKILLKTDPLGDDELRFMREHCAMGRDILTSTANEAEITRYREHTTIGREILGDEDSELLRIAGRIAACHHERWDGSGYPEGLSGEDIPIEARIVAAVDVYDALSSKRPYKDNLSEEECQRFIRESSGVFFDPRVVDVFFDAIDGILEIKEKWKD